jgi:hypothetical protein
LPFSERGYLAAQGVSCPLVLPQISHHSLSVAAFLMTKFAFLIWSDLGDIPLNSSLTNIKPLDYLTLIQIFLFKQKQNLFSAIAFFPTLPDVL